MVVVVNSKRTPGLFFSKDRKKAVGHLEEQKRQRQGWLQTQSGTNHGGIVRVAHKRKRFEIRIQGIQATLRTKNNDQSQPLFLTRLRFRVRPMYIGQSAGSPAAPHFKKKKMVGKNYNV